MAGVNMRLKPGAIREPHWHKEAEWAYMLAGSARVTCIDAEGRNFIDDVGTGDLWNFRAGLPHSIQALADGCEFLLVFDDGAFSENETLLLTDWFKHTPLDVLAKNLGVSPSALANIPRDPDTERYIFNGEVPPPLAKDLVRGPAGEAMQMTWRLLGQQLVEVPGGRVRIVDSTNFHAASTIAAPGRVGPRRHAGAALAPDQRRVAVLHLRAGQDDSVRLQRQGEDLRLPGRRRGLRPVRDGPLHPQHR